MQQEILSRGSLTELIQRPSLDLYTKERQTKPMEDIVEMMRKDIKLAISRPLAVPAERRLRPSRFPSRTPERL